MHRKLKAGASLLAVAALGVAALPGTASADICRDVASTAQVCAAESVPTPDIDPSIEGGIKNDNDWTVATVTIGTTTVPVTVENYCVGSDEFCPF